MQAEIDYEYNLGLVQSIIGDQHRIQQILLNFLSNALKFTNEGGKITIQILLQSVQSLEAEQKDENNQSSRRKEPKKIKVRQKSQSQKSLSRSYQMIENEEFKANDVNSVMNNSFMVDDIYFVHLQLLVCDTGCGISEEGLKKLFVDFGKLEENEGGNPTGTGLGLMICKEIVEQMGGSVTVTSEINKGTSFIIDLKAKSKAFYRKPHKIDPTLEKYKFLYSLDSKLKFISCHGALDPNKSESVKEFNEREQELFEQQINSYELLLNKNKSVEVRSEEEKVEEVKEQV